MFPFTKANQQFARQQSQHAWAKARQSVTIDTREAIVPKWEGSPECKAKSANTTFTQTKPSKAVRAKRDAARKAARTGFLPRAPHHLRSTTAV